MMNMEKTAVYLVTDRNLALGRELERVVEEAVLGGVGIVQLREKEASAEEFTAIGRRLKHLLEPYGVPLIINDRIDVALACGADGVHIGQSDAEYALARRMLGPDRIIGLSIETMEELEQANRLDVDYVAASPIFRTPTKTDTSEPWGLDGLERFARVSEHPVVAIGGINEGNAAEVFRHGAGSIAVVSAIMSAPSPREAVAKLREIYEKTR